MCRIDNSKLFYATIPHWKCPIHWELVCLRAHYAELALKIFLLFQSMSNLESPRLLERVLG